MQKINPDDYRVSGKAKIQKRPTLETLGANEDELETELQETARKIAKIQEKLYAHNRYSVLIGLQGMDTSGKDSLVREVFKEFNVRGIEVHSFKVPTALELQHDYLWRHQVALPERGKFGIFNRTHYENVLVTRVHPEHILSENLPGIETVKDIKPKFWEKRFEQIRQFEKHIFDNGTIVLKFFLHVSKEEQRQRLLRRLEEADHNWKFSPGDLRERSFWEQYQQCYEEAISETSTDDAPWFVVPADDKKAARCIVAQIILEALKPYHDIDEPELDDKIKQNIAEYRKQLESEQ